MAPVCWATRLPPTLYFLFLLFCCLGDVSTLLCDDRLALLNIRDLATHFQLGNPTFSIPPQPRSILSEVPAYLRRAIATPPRKKC